MTFVSVVENQKSVNETITIPTLQCGGDASGGDPSRNESHGPSADHAKRVEVKLR